MRSVKDSSRPISMDRATTIFVMAGITGIMCILMGLLAEIIMRTYYESQGKPVYLIDECRNLDNN